MGCLSNVNPQKLIVAKPALHQKRVSSSQIKFNTLIIEIKRLHQTDIPQNSGTIFI